MKNIILLLVLTIFFFSTNVSAADTGSGTNTSPTAVDDFVTTDENTSVEIDLISNDTDNESDTLTVTWISDSLNWSWVITPSWTWVIFTPDTDFNWTASFNYTVSDWELSDIWRVEITVNFVNQWPVAVDDTVTTDNETAIEIDLVSNDTDSDGDNLTVTDVSNMINWSWVITSNWTWVIFTPDSDFIWTASFNYTVTDWMLFDTWNVLITVIEVNSIPETEDDEVETFVNTNVSIDPRENDTDDDFDTLSVVDVTDWSHWVVQFTSVLVKYIPDTDYVWSDTFTYTIDDWNWWNDIWTINVTIKKREEEDDDENDEDEDDDNDDDKKNKHVVKNIQKEYIKQFKELKKDYKGLMWNRDSRNEYLRLKAELRKEYLEKLKDATWKSDNYEKKYSYEWSDSKKEYKNKYKKKYWKKISKLNTTQLETLVWKIDNLIDDVNNWNYSDDSKAKYNTMLLALRELVVEYMDNDDNVLDIDSLFE